MNEIDIPKNRKVAVFAPASMGNTSVSYDLVGTAIRPMDGDLLGDIVTVSFSNHDQDEISIEGLFGSFVPHDDSNIVNAGLKLFNENLLEKKIQSQYLAVTLDKRLAVGTGLGSSGSSAVATISSLNRFYGYPFNQDEALKMMSQLESNISGSLHYDNVAPSYLGGMLIVDNRKPKNIINLPYNKEFILVVCYNGEEISTSMAREILPQTYPKDVVIHNALNLGYFIHYSHMGNYNKAISYMKEIVAEPYRKQLISDYDLAYDKCLEMGGLNFGISGSGPTVFGIFDDEEKANQFNRWLERNFIKKDIGFSRLCQISSTGVEVVADLET